MEQSKANLKQTLPFFLKVACKVQTFQSYNQDGEKKDYFFAEIAAHGK